MPLLAILGSVVLVKTAKVAPTSEPPPAAINLTLELRTRTPAPLLNGAAFFTGHPRGFNNNATLLPPPISQLQRLGEDDLLGWHPAGGRCRAKSPNDRR